MAFICLLGRHGSGKSTIGSVMSEYGYQHTSVGMLRRLARSAQFPSDVPASLMMAIRREKAGAALSLPSARKLIHYACAVPNVVLDGFPSCLEHIPLLPPESVFCLVWTPAPLRLQRLEHRSDTTRRIWTPGQHSERETSLPGLLRELRQSRRCIFVANDATPEAAARLILGKLVGS